MLLTNTETTIGLAKRYNLDPAVLMAVIEVESSGQVFAFDNLPVIRWEGHYFDRLVPADKRAEARAKGFAHPTAGVVPNPVKQPDRYALLAEAMKIDKVAALSSISIGVGQVMGSHWKVLGFNTVHEMFALAQTGFSGQIELMLRYIMAFGLLDELQRLDWEAFARGYNGKNYAKGRYHIKLRQAYERLTGKASTTTASGMLRMGSKGIAVREVQQLLLRAGYSVKVDGDFGPSTRDAIRTFQQVEGIAVDGVVGPETMSRLNAYRSSPDENLGTIPVTEVQEVKDAAVVGGGAAAGLLVAENTLNNAAEKLSGVPGMALIANGLVVAAVCVSLAALAYGAWGWLESRK